MKKAVGPLMKKFQSEIDSLTKRAKAAEQAFLSVYTKLHDAPDPVAILEGAVSDQKRSAETKELEIENKRLQATIQEYVSCRVVPCRAVPCRVVSCRAVPCRAVSCLHSTLFLSLSLSLSVCVCARACIFLFGGKMMVKKHLVML